VYSARLSLIGVMISHHCHNIIIAASYTLITCSRHWSFCYRI